VQQLTPLHKAAWRDDAEALNALLDAGAAVDAGDAAGRRPLHHAAAAGARAACEKLLSHGADASATADDGSTAATAAATAGFGALAEEVLARAQYAPSEADDAARARWAKAFVDAGCATSHHAAALVESNAGDRRYGEVGFWTSALILRAAGKGQRIADLGSGVGRFTLAAALLMPEARVVGVEIAPELHVHDCVEIKFRTPHASTRRCPRNCICSMAWRFYAIDATNLTG